MTIMSIIRVYDVFKRKFRDLMPTNYNDDIAVGAVILSKEALKEITKYYVICGYVLIDKETKMKCPIDIHPDRLVLFEGTYNGFPKNLKNDLIRYNITFINDRIWSHFFFEWNFMSKWDCFTNNGPFIEMCSNFLGDELIISKMVNDSISIIEPTTYGELCEMTKNSIELSGTDYIGQDYDDSFKYLVDSLINNYHIIFSANEIKKYALNICYVINKQWENNHA